MARVIPHSRSSFPAIGRFPFWRVIEEWVRQREAAPAIEEAPVLVDGQISLEQLTLLARLCEADAPGEPMTPMECIDWISYFIEGHRPTHKPSPDVMGRPYPRPTSMKSAQ